MTTISVPLSPDYTKILNNLVSSGYGANRADVMRRALRKADEDAVIARLLAAANEPSLKGDLRTLMNEFPE